MPDILKGEVFPAIRNGYISFYYKGGGLFEYRNGRFSTHRKYAFIPKDIKADYITEDVLNHTQHYLSFFDAYEKIKENCKLYGTIEADVVSNLYKCSVGYSGDVVLLDTEIAFSADKRRVDLLLYNKNTQTMVFCEAKHYSNSELWSAENTAPAVVRQVKAYKDIIRRESNTIVEQYGNYVEAFNKLFGLSYPVPVNLVQNVGLLIVGYDSYQIPKIEKMLIQDGSLDGIPYYTKQTPDNISELFRKITKEV